MGIPRVLVPVVGESNSFPGMRGLELNVSGRYDDYSDFGDTTNPEYALNWTIVHGLRVRANYAESFTAPALTSRGNAAGITAESSFGGLLGATASGVNANFAIPNTYPGAIGLPGYDCDPDMPHQHVERAWRVPRGPQQGSGRAGRRDVLGRPRYRARSAAGIALQRDVVEHEVPRRHYRPASGVRDRLAGSQQPAAAVSGRCAGGCARDRDAGPAADFAVGGHVVLHLSFQQRNAFNLEATGIDGDLSYQFRTDVGTFLMGVAVSHKLKMDQQFGSGGETFSVLNTIGINTTFPSNRTAGRLNLGWSLGGLSTDVFVNYNDSLT